MSWEYAKGLIKKRYKEHIIKNKAGDSVIFNYPYISNGPGSSYVYNFIINRNEQCFSISSKNSQGLRQGEQVRCLNNESEIAEIYLAIQEACFPETKNFIKDIHKYIATGHSRKDYLLLPVKVKINTKIYKAYIDINRFVDMLVTTNRHVEDLDSFIYKENEDLDKLFNDELTDSQLFLRKVIKGE